VYFLEGPRDVVATVLLLAAPHLEGSGAGAVDTATLKRAYRAYLRGLNPAVAAGESGGARIVGDEDEASSFSAAFGLPASSTPAEAAMPTWKRSLCKAGQEQLRTLDPQLCQIFDLVVSEIFSAPVAVGAGSMTTADALGVIWVGPRREWSAGDVTEAYVHELTHILLTLDEHRFGHYRDYGALAAEDNMCLSAIRREKRPLNAVVHSAVVAHELLELRRLTGAHEAHHLHASSAEIERRARASHASMLALPNLEALCAPRMIELIADLGKALDRREALVG
jgi:hypothetical protein